MKSLWRFLVPLLVGAILWMSPTPQGLETYAWHFFAIFAGVIVALVLEPIPAAAAGLVGVTLAACLLLIPAPPAAPKPTEPAKTAPAPAAEAKPPAVADAAKTDAAKPAAAAKAALKAAKDRSIKWALSGFSNSTVWLIFVAFMFALGYEKTGLGRRISLVLIKALGKSTLGLGYAVAFADLVLAPFMPSNTARSGGTIYPVIKNIPELYDSSPDKEPRKIGGYLMWVALATTCVTSSMFLSGLAPNLLALSLVEKTAKVSFTWGEWAMGFLPVGVILVLSVPYLTYLIYPPTQKRSEDAPRWAGEELAKMGAVSAKEWLMAGLAVLALALWIFAKDYIDATTAALVVLSLMILAKVITWDDLLGHKQAWNVLVWFGTLVAMADGLNLVGFLKWFATSAAKHVVGYSPSVTVMLLVALFFVVHYMFASLTAHVAALLPVILATAMGVAGLPMKPLAMLLCFSLGLMGILTPYATGPSPIYYGSGYISPKAFWALGLVFGIIFLGVFLAVGAPWMLSMK